MALLLLAAAGRPHASLAQQLGRIPRIAVLMPYREGDPLIADLRTAFERALSDLGWIDDRNIEIEYRLAGGDLDRLHSLANDLVKHHPDVIVASPSCGLEMQWCGSELVKFEPVTSLIVASLGIVLMGLPWCTSTSPKSIILRSLAGRKRRPVNTRPLPSSKKCTARRQRHRLCLRRRRSREQMA